MNTSCAELSKKIERIALVNLITQTSLVRNRAPQVISNKDAMIVAFARALRKQGVAADIFVSDAYQPKNQEDLGARVFYLPTRLKSIFWPSCIPFTPSLVKHLESYDIVVCSEVFQLATVLAVIAKRFRKKNMKLIVWQEMARHQRLAGGFLSKFYHSVIVKYFLDRHIDFYIPRGELAKEFLLRQGIAREKITEPVSHGIDPEKFYHDPSVQKERYIFSPSRLVYCKGIDVLLKAFALVCQDINDLKLIIQGNGPLLIEYQALAYKLKIDQRVVFQTDRLDHHRMRERYQKALLTIIASRSDLVIFSDLESMACGTPVILSTGVDSYVHYRDGKGGRYFESGNYQQLAKVILLFVKNQIYYRRIEAEALEKSKNFSNVNVAQNIYNVLCKHSKESHKNI